MRQISKEIHKQLMAAKKIIIIPHQHPDGDSLGSAGALKEFLNTVNKDATIFCASPAQSKYHFIPHARTLSNEPRRFADKAVDTIVVLDSGDLRYAGVDVHLKNHPAQIINIDHHPTNEKYGDINLVMPTASSTAEILFYFFKHNEIKINQIMSTALLTGIITDTDNFTNSATNPMAMLIASELLRTGGNLNLINQYTIRNKSLAVLKLWGAALSRLTKHEGKDLTYTYLTQKDFENYNVSENEADGIANFLNNLEGSKTSLILKETADGKIKGSFRTTSDEMDVAAWAKRLGGGGHKKAAGFSLEGKMEEVLQKILLKN
ncbi:MAG: bifunctional oligoribonuclease/PAP phosphatase NrnA [Candidatus Magasanikbacteria bacterium]